MSMKFSFLSRAMVLTNLGLLTLVLLTIGTLPALGQARSENKSTSDTSRSQTTKVKVLKQGCTDRRSNCMSLAYVRTEFFNIQDMTSIAKSLRRRYRSKSEVMAFLYNDLDNANALIKGRPEPQSLSRYAKGMYFLSKKEEYIKFSTAGGPPFTWDVTIDLKRNPH